MANFLTFGYFPKTEEAAKNQQPGQAVFGAAVAKSEFVKAVLAHGSYERYYFLCDSEYSLPEVQNKLATYRGSERAEVVPVEDSHKLRQIERMILFMPDSSITDLIDMRRFFGRPGWPITGVTHSLSFTAGMVPALTAFFEDMFSYDGLVCTSQAGRKVVEEIVKSIGAHLRDRQGLNVEWKVQLPVIPLGVDASVFATGDKQMARRRLKIADNCKVFLYFGRFSAIFKMDPWPLLLCFSESLAREKQDVLLVLAGDDTFFPLAPQIKHIATQLGISDKVLIRPNATNAEKLALYSAADVFISPVDNIQETFGITVIEAMAAGLPVIASDWNGYRDSVVHGETGYLVTTAFADCVDYLSRLSALKDAGSVHWMLSQAVSVDMAEMSQYMRALYESPDLRRRLGEQGRRRVLEHFDWPRIVQQYEALWADLLEQALRSPVPDQTGTKHGLTSYDYLSVFGHYASAIATVGMSIQITPLGIEYVQGKVHIAPLTFDLGSFKSKLLYQIASDCSDGVPQAIRRLIEHVREEADMPTEIVFHHIIRLVKYGILQMVSPDSSR